MFELIAIHLLAVIERLQKCIPDCLKWLNVAQEMLYEFSLVR